VARAKISLEGAHRYRKFLEGRFHGDVALLNLAYHETRDYFDLQVPREQWHLRTFQPMQDRKFRELLEFKATLPDRFRFAAPIEGMYREFLRTKYGREVEVYQKRYGIPLQNFADLRLPERLPKQPDMARDWAEYVRQEIPYHFIAVDPAAEPKFQAFLKQKYHGDLELYNRNYSSEVPKVPEVSKVPKVTDDGTDHGSRITDWSQIRLPAETPTEGFALSDWADFIEKDLPPEYVRLRTPETLFRAHLRQRYGTIDALNREYGTRYARFADVAIPVEAADWWYMQRDKKAIRREFTVRNYRDVIIYITVHGRALWNTFVLVTAMIFLTLTVNPLAAYALSRYNLPQTYKILLFVLATMAFPAEVSAIPNFLLLKKLGLLNTFWALLLPGAANGFAIFLLKGFFDGLPQDLYEAAELDGANEFQMYTHICFPMSKPVLAVIALGAFGAAYGSFLWAFVVCQNPRMWTLMVWLQQMASWAPQSMIFAALCLAAIPTLLVFIFAQNIIMRGVIIPMEK
jgi:multiple sugar transport system permease protein